VEWSVTIETCSLPTVARCVANREGIGLVLDIPPLRKMRGVRLLPLPHFTPVELASFWRPLATSLMVELRKTIEQRARELWPEEIGKT
jgi:DNA-binding transcriptional LysR family regulator